MEKKNLILSGVAAFGAGLMQSAKAQWPRLALVLVVCALCTFGAFHIDPIGAGIGVMMLGEMDTKAIETAIANASKEVKATVDRMQQALDQAVNDSKTKGALTDTAVNELKTASAENLKAQKALKDALEAGMQDVRQELDKVKASRSAGNPQSKTWGETVAASEQFKAAVDRETKSKKSAKPEMDAVEVGSWHKTRILSSDQQTASGTVNYLSQAERAPFVAGTERQLVVRSLIPVYQTESPLIEFARELVFTNSAAPQGSGSSPAETEAQPKAESAITFEFVQQPVITIAHWIPASRQVLSDAKMLGSYIDQRLRYGVLLEEEDEVINSTGTNGELNGLWNQGTAFNRSATADTELDQLLKAMLQVTLSDYAADGVVMSNVDWTNLMLLKDTTGRYLFGDPTSANPSPRVWGRPVIPTNSMTAGRFIVGAFQLAAALWDREQATVRVAEQHSDYFVRNMVVILAEERVALVVYRPTAIVKGSFHTGGQPG